MAEEPKVVATENVVPLNTRRGFVKTAAQVAVTAPAVAVLLSASTKPAAAQRLYDPKNPNSSIGDDFHISGDNFGDNASF